MGNVHFGPDQAEIMVGPIVNESLMAHECNYCSSVSLGTVIDLVADKTVLVDFTNTIPFFKYQNLIF